MGQLIQNMQMQIKKSSQSFALFAFKMASGFLLGLVFALAGQEAFAYEMFAFWFVTLFVMSVFLKISKPWGFGAVVVYNLVCVLLGLLLRMYVLMAPG